jgi:hypothetical protein
VSMVPSSHLAWLGTLSHLSYLATKDDHSRATWERLPIDYRLCLPIPGGKMTATTPKKVKCIDDGGYAQGSLKAGQTYEVVRTYHASDTGILHYEVKGGGAGGWRASRFEVVEEGEPLRVRYIDDNGSLSSSYGITLGNVYTVKAYQAGVSMDAYTLEEIPGIWFGTSRFEIVEGPTSSVKPQHIATLPDTDPEETRLRALFTAPPAGACPCGIPRHQCRYHDTLKDMGR